MLAEGTQFADAPSRILFQVLGHIVFRVSLAEEFGDSCLGSPTITTLFRARYGPDRVPDSNLRGLVKHDDLECRHRHWRHCETFWAFRFGVIIDRFGIPG